MSESGLKTVLLVEDEAIISLARAMAIEGFGYRAVTASTGEKAVSLALENEDIGLVLMDIDLGKGIDGTEAARRILSARTVPIVFLTSHGEREMVEKVRGITRYGYVIKNSGDFVLASSIEMAFELFEAHEGTKAKETELEAIYENAPIVMMLLDRERRVRKANGKVVGFSGLPLADAIGLRCGEAMHCLHSLDSTEGCGFGRPCAECMVRSTVLSTFETGLSRDNVEASMPFLVEGIREDLFFLLSTRALTVAGEPLVLVSLMDITNRKRAEELKRKNAELQELDRLKSMFIASMSQELRTPLNSIIGFSSILGEEWAGQVTPEQKENLAIIQRSGKLLLSLLNNVIDVSELEAGTIEARFEEFDLRALLEEAAMYVADDIRKKGLSLRLEAAGRRLFSDRRRLLQCVTNLLLNAVKFTEKGEIALSAGLSEDPRSGEPGRPRLPLAISVRDTGIGISPEDMRRLFEPFVRLDSRLGGKASGAGIGLFLTRKLAMEILQGDISCESVVDEGSVFTLRIPERIDGKGPGSRR